MRCSRALALTPAYNLESMSVYNAILQVRGEVLTCLSSSFASSSKVLLNKLQCLLSFAFAFRKASSSCSLPPSPARAARERNEDAEGRLCAWRRYKSHDRAKLRQAVSWFSRAESQLV